MRFLGKFSGGFWSFFFACLALLPAQPSAAFSAGERKPVLILVGSELGRDTKWFAAQCKKFNGWVAVAPGQRHRARCQPRPMDSFQKMLADKELRVDPDYAYHFLLWEDFANEWHLQAVRTEAGRDPMEFNRLEWRMSSKSTEEMDSGIQKMLFNVLAFDLSKDQLKGFFVEVAAPGSKAVEYKDGKFFDRATKQEIPMEQAYELYQKEGPRQKNYLRAGLELTVLLGLGVNWYYKNVELNKVDWDYANKGFVESMKTRFTSFDAVRFDNNPNAINRKHIIPTGIGYYMFARSNNLSAPESLLSSFVASSLWEYFVEHSEVVSINDMIMTPMGGFVLGEVVHQIGRYFRGKGRQNGSRLYQAIGTVVDPATAFNAMIDKYTGGRGNAYHNDFDPNMWGRVEFFLYQSNNTNSMKPALAGEHKGWGVNAEIINAPIEMEGKDHRLIFDQVFNKLLIEVTNDEHATSEMIIKAKTSLFLAYHARDISKDSAGRPYGYSVTFGPTATLNMEHAKDKKEVTYHALDTNVGVFGSTIDVVTYIRDVKVRMTIDGHGTTHMIRSYAFEKNKDAIDTTGVVSELVNEGHYYGAGYQAGGQISVEYKGFEIGGGASQQNVYGIESRSRYYETEDKRLNPQDTTNAGEVFFRVPITKNGSLKCGVEVKDKVSSISGFEDVTMLSTKKYCQGALVF